MKNNLEKKNYKDNIPAENQEQTDLLDKNQIEKDIKDAYLEDIDFQLELEEQILEEFSKTKNTSLKETLAELRRSGEEVLRKTSSKIVEIFNSNKLAVTIRDKYIEKRGNKIYKELSVDNKLSSVDDYDSFLKTLSSDFWGSSNNSDEALIGANKALTSITAKFTQKSSFLEDSSNWSDEYWHGAKDVLSVWPKLLSKDDPNKIIKTGLGSYLNRLVSGLGYYSDESKKLTAKYIKNGHDFIALKALSSLSLDAQEADFPGETLLRIDSLIRKFPNSKNLPDDIKNLLIDFADSKPEEFLSDSRRTNFIFNLWLNDVKTYPDHKFRNIMPLFINRIANCSEDETKQILAVLNKNWARSHSGFSDDFAWILNVLPVDKKDLKPFVEKTKAGLSGGYIVALKEAELSRTKISDEDFSDILSNIKSITSGEDLILVSSLIVKYPNEALGMGSERIEQILDVLKERVSDRFDVENLQALNVLMNNNNWPSNLKEKIFSLIKINNNLTLKILNDDGDNRYSWVKNEPLLWYQLQITFHEKAPAHELRHYFYEVLDGKKVSDNLDHLIKSYAASTNHLDFEELRSLFLDAKIDKKYIEYFIDKVYVTDVLAGLENNSINLENTQFILEATIKNGPLEGQIKVLEKLLSLETYKSPEKRQKMIELMPKNIVNKIDGNINDWSLEGVAIDILSNYDYKKEFLSDEEISNLGRGFLNESLSIKNDSKLTLITLIYPDKIRNFFTDENKNGDSVSDREEYLTKLFERLAPNGTNNVYSLITKAYFSGLDIDIHNEETRLKIENKFLELRALNHSDFVDCFDNLNEEQVRQFLNYFEKNSFIDQNQSQGVTDICNSLVKRNNLGALKKIYLKLLNDNNLLSSQATILFKEDIIFGDEDIRNSFFSNIGNWPQVDGTTILETASRRKNTDNLNDKTEAVFSLTQEEIKKISTAIISNRGLSPRFWKNYLNSGMDNGDFYLDKNLFEVGIKNIGPDCFLEKAGEIVSFLTSIGNSKFEIKESDIEYIITNSFQENNNSNQTERLQVFYQYKPELIEKIIIDDKNSYFYKIFNNIFGAGINYSSSFKEKAIEYLFRSKRNQYDIFLNYLSKNNDQESVEKFKDYLEKCDEPSSKFSARLSMLKYDLLSVAESKQLYSEITSSSKDNVREQILNSIDVISSMLSNRNNISKLENFLDNPKPEHIEGLREMSDFIEKYSKENKGRSIVVMLFAREYLPDRKIEDVIEKVSGSLRKYNEIIDRNSYKNIPEGIRASIGMEYEITSSTADGYQKLTGQASLKNDIARLSKAARIGAGKDAVHEIATRPTDNPYLMLLEMKLLHDIEYIDFNFSRSEEYQKGARGFHLTIGGEKGISVNQESNFLQNAILAASWGGVQSGESGHKVNGGRGVSLRGRSADGVNNNVQFFEKPTESVELRSLSIDKQETFQRAVTTAFNGAIAIQAFKECFPDGSEKALKMIIDNSEEEKIRNIINSKPEKIAQIANIWLDLVIKINKAAKDHDSFLDRETYGYLDDKNIWVDTVDFGGEYNKKRFQSILENIDPTLSVDEYVETTKINVTELFRSFSVELSDKLIKINNLYLKPGTSSINKEGEENRVFKGDHTNASSMLKVTKLDNDTLEYYGEDFLDNTIFDTAGEKRKGYYTLQGGSELMITHAVQKALLEFNTRIEKIVN